jgi:hypothetical protein
MWLNGPGLRWLGPRLAQHFLNGAGVAGNFRIEGSLSHGLSITAVKLRGPGTLANLTVERITPHYQWSRLAKGQLDGISVAGAHAELRLGPDAGPPPKDEANQPLDLDQLVRTLRNLRAQLVPMQLDFQRLSLTATRAGTPAFQLEPSHLAHASGSDQFTLQIGRITDANGRQWPAQTAHLAWAADHITLDRLAPLPGLGVSAVTLHLPTTGGPAVEALIHLDDAVLQLQTSAGFTTAHLALTAGAPDLQQAAKCFGLNLPATATLSALTLELADLMPNPAAATARVALTLDSLTYQDWRIPHALVSGVLANDRATVTLRAQPLGAPVSLDGLQLITHYDISARTYAGEVSLNGFASSRIDRWLAIAGINAGGTAELTGHWQGGGSLSTNTHHGELTLTQGAWHAAGKPTVTAAGIVRYTWPNNASVSNLKAQAGPQSLTLDCLAASWRQPETGPLATAAALWPVAAEIRNLQLHADQQSISVSANLEDGLLKIGDFTWRDAETVIANGSASLPVPQDFSTWRDTLANDTRPASMALHSRQLPLAMLQPWLAAAAHLDPRATGQVDITLTGNYVDPSLAATLECLNLRSPANPKLPPAALKVTLQSGAGQLQLDGSLTTPDYAPALLTASLPFRPAAWAAAPESLKQEPLTARAELPRLDLARFTTLLPMARQLTGWVTGNLVVAGKLAAPELRGTVHLTNGGIVFADAKLPPVQAAAAAIDLTLDAVTLKNLRATIAGGSLTGGGALNLTAGKPAAVDFRLRGDHLPLLRNDMLILRANLDLRLHGPWQTAALTGTVGAVDSLFFRDIELLPIGKPFTAPSAAALPRMDAAPSPGSALPAPFGNWGLDLAVRTQQPFLIRGNLATGRVDAKLRLGGTLGNPLPDGVATLTDFVATLPFSTLKVKSGMLRFTPATGFDPLLEIRGVAEPRPYRIDVYAYGKLSDPQLVLTSNPPLPESEIMTLLATGTTSAGLENTQAAASRAIQLFAEEVRRGRVRYVRQLRPLFGLLDRVDFSLAESDPYSSDALSTATLNLTEHWLVSAGMGVDGNTRVLGIWRISFR